ncbi:MAG: hypothetical protein Q8R83_09265 [Legionellaceae bacterium]|nr:hypothetical protein [Legionellaceae bacterium]
MQDRNITIMPTASAPSSATAITAAVVGVTALAAGAVVTYAGYKGLKWFFQPYSFSHDELERHRILTSEYKKMGLTCPEYWTLTENHRPTFELDYKEVRTQLDNVIDEIRFHGSAIHVARTSILSLLSRYLESLSKRAITFDRATGAYARDDGVEAMFLSEMITWWLNIVPHKPEASDDVIEAFEKRCDYCRHLISQITRSNWKCKYRANFNDFLNRLSKEMDDYHQHLVNHSKMVNFNLLVDKLKNELSSLAVQSFNMLFLMIRGASQERINISQFKNPEQSDVKIRKMRETGLGDWLFKTLTLPGIDASTYETTVPLTPSMIINHLQNEHPEDEPCLLRDELRDAVSKQWGHWDFATEVTQSSEIKIKGTTDKAPQKSLSLLKLIGLKKEVSNHPTENSDTLSAEQKARRYLKMMRDLMRMTLRIIYQNQSLEKSQFVVNVYGQVWIYGTPIGTVSLDELLFGVRADVNLYEQTCKSFWSGYFSDFQTYTRIKGINSAEHSCYRWIHQINNDNKTQDKTIRKIAGYVNQIKSNAQDLPQTIEEADDKMMELIGDIKDRMCFFYDRENTDNYRALSEAFNKLQRQKEQRVTTSTSLLNIEMQRQPGPTRLPSNMQMTILEYRKSHLKYYDLIDKIIRGKMATDSFILSLKAYDLLSDKTDFRFPEMKHLYQRYIRVHHDEMVNFYKAFFTFSSKIPSKKRNEFKSMYERVSAIFNLLYAHHSGFLSSPPLDIEILFAGQFMRLLIEADFEKHQYYHGFSLYSSGLLTISEKKGDSGIIEVTLDGRWLRLTEGLLMEESKHLKAIILAQDEELRNNAQTILELNQRLNDVDALNTSQDEVREKAKHPFVDATKQRQERADMSTQDTSHHRFMKPVKEPANTSDSPQVTHGMSL